MKTFFERDFSEPIQNHLRKYISSLNNSGIKSKVESGNQSYKFPDSITIKDYYPALFYWYMVREISIEKKLDYLVIVQQLYDSLKSTYISSYGEDDLAQDIDIGIGRKSTLKHIESSEEDEDDDYSDEDDDYSDKDDDYSDKDSDGSNEDSDGSNQDSDDSDYSNNNSNDASDLDYGLKESSNEKEDCSDIDESNSEMKKKKSIKLLIKVYDSSMVNNTFIQKDIKPIQKFYLENYQINSVDVSLSETDNNSGSGSSSGSGSGIIKAPTQLIKVYNQFKKESLLIKHNYADKQLFTRQSISKYESTHPMVDYSLYTDPVKLEKDIGLNKVGDWSIVQTLELFKECFNVYTNNILHGIDWGNDCDSGACKVIASGGSVTSCLTSLPKSIIKQYLELLNIYRLISNHLGLPFSASKLIFEYLRPYHSFYQQLFDHFHGGSSPYMKGDIDLFFIAPTIEQGKKKLESVAQKIRENLVEKKGLDFKFVRTQNSISILSVYPYRQIQLMVFFIRSMEDLMIFYDLDCSCACYNGDNVYVLPRTVNALNKRLNMVPPSIFSKDNERLYKYCLRGFKSICFENCIHNPRCDRKSSLYYDILDEIQLDEYSRPKFILSGYGQSSSIVSFPYGPETKFAQVLETIDIYSYRCSSRFKSSMLDPNPKKDVISIFPVEWRFYHIKVDALSSKLSFKCYVCKNSLQDTSTRLCLNCKLNSSEKLLYFISSGYIRKAKDAIKHKVAIVTGGRIKIGYETAKFLLDCGFKVIITTRFPASAYEHYKKNCAPNLLSNLYIYGVDFRDLNQVQQFIDTIKKEFSRVDILINNAAQTIRYPRSYYNSILEKERDVISSFDKVPKNILSNISIQNNNNNKSIQLNGDSSISSSSNYNKEILVFNKQSNNSTDLVNSIITRDDEDQVNELLFPKGKTDAHGQQLDLRTKHTWNQTIEEITTAEMLEVQLINNTVPFMLINQLSSIMGSNKNDDEIISSLSDEEKAKYLKAKSKMNRSDWSVIVNVTSPEGSFQNEPNSISGFHCHTNSAKAALNMLTKTIAYQFEKKNIYVIGCDTGWVSNMMPYSPLGEPSRPPPLSEFAGASRVLYPVYHHLFKKDRYPSGVQFVHFKPTNW